MAYLAGFCVFAFTVHILGLAIAAWRAGRKRAPTELVRQKPPVTILRPVCGIDPFVRETLRSTFALDHPEVDIVFCVASSADPVIPIVERLIGEHPERQARLLVGDDRVSVNPKLNNLVKGWKAARHPWIVMVDSNVLLPRDFIDRLMERWTPGTGLVCSPPVGALPRSAGAELECAWLNSYQARWQLAADTLGFGFAQGKVMLWRREVLEHAGGIERLAGEVAEDAAATKIVRQAGLAVRLVDRPFPQPLGDRSFGDVWRRQVRWARLRKSSFPAFFAPEILAGGLLPVAGAGLLAAFGYWPASAVAIYVAAWYGAELLAAFRAGWSVSVRQFAAMLARDCLLPALFAATFAGNGFEWRGNAMEVPGGSVRTGAMRKASRRVAARIREAAFSRR
ncbi:ceramide glucosyltransferase [Chthonobacter albigriseus]|uniref:ceramide glucosyltransferase n=1 Tax=Chthonobacter albigriseus TaxID=1683161 RepID=UPI0015EF9577|nr:ceramide glucosyltransferase [Chthonobacter albigriseus]